MAFAVAAVTTGALLTALPPAATATAGTAESRVIVELSGTPAASGARFDAADTTQAAGISARRRAITAAQDGFLAGARQAGVHAAGVHRFTLLSDAVAMTVPQGEVAALRRLPGVTSVSPDTPVHTLTDVSVPLIGAPDVWRKQAPNGAKARGKGVTVAVLDSGIDYDHPDLGGGFGPGHKVVAGHDFVNGDDDPMDDNGHGTHVAGIIAAKAAEPGGITGVAPDATLTAWKVMDDSGSGYTSDIIAGLEAATDPANPYRADVVNMSLGGPGDGTDPLGRAATAAVRAGVVVVAAAGNDGPGPGTVGTPASADGVIAVGASTSGVRLSSASYVVGRKTELVQATPWFMSANGPVKPVTAPVVDLGTATPEVDWSQVGDVRGKALLVEHPLQPAPDGWFADLAAQAERRGAVALFAGAPSGSAGPQSVPAERGVVPAQPGSPHISASGDDTRFDSIVLMGLDEFAYREMAARAAAPGGARVRITGTDVTDQLASFSSRGPTAAGFALKPDLVAPGVQIRSTMYSAWPSGVYRMSGTSMAAPHVAGAAALLRQLRPHDTPQQVTSALVGSAKPLDGPSVTAQGAGRLDVSAAADRVLSASPASVSLGLADLARPTVGATGTVTVSNPGTRRISATVKVSGSASVTPRQISLPAGGTARVTVHVSAERPSTDTDFGGRITLRPDHGPDLTVPYLLAARPLIVKVSPDPSDGHATAYVYSPTPLAAPPVLTVTPPHGRPVTVTATLDHATWYTAAVTGAAPGVYRVTASSLASTGQRLVGGDAFEVTSPTADGSAWQPVGPNDESGALTVAPSAPSRAVLAQPGKAALWFTSDKGASWSQLGRLPVAEGTGDVVIDPADADHWWYAVEDGLGKSHILQTRDHGRTWQVLADFDAGIVAFTADDKARVLVAVTATDLIVSRDGGATWTTSPSGVPGTIGHAVLGGGDLYLQTYDNGLWSVPGFAGGTPDAARQLLTSTLVSGLAADGDMVAVWEIGNGVMVSQDRGRTWSTTLTLPYSGGGGLIESGGDLFIGAGSDDTSWVSHDRGRTWNQVALPTARAFLTDYDRWPDGSVTISSAEDGLYRSAADGSGARRIGVQGQTVFDLAVSGSTLLAGTWSGSYRTALPVASPEWGKSGGEGCVGCQVPQLATGGPGVVWRTVELAIGSFNVQRSTDSGATWTTLGNYGETPDALLVDPADPDHVSVAYHVFDESGIYTTTDGGATWKVLHQSRIYDTLVADPGRRGRMWLGAADGLYRSDDGGATVTKVTDGPVGAITFDGPRLIVGGDGIRISTDGGRTFRAADLGGLPTTVSDVVRAGGALYAAAAASRPNGLLKGGRGVLRSTDDGRTWTNVSAGLQNLAATRLAVSPDGKALYVGTIDGGVHRLTLRR